MYRIPNKKQLPTTYSGVLPVVILLVSEEGMGGGDDDNDQPSSSISLVWPTVDRPIRVLDRGLLVTRSYEVIIEYIRNNTASQKVIDFEAIDVTF